jgi:hypothetical protein
VAFTNFLQMHNCQKRKKKDAFLAEKEEKSCIIGGKSAKILRKMQSKNFLHFLQFYTPGLEFYVLLAPPTNLN